MARSEDKYRDIGRQKYNGKVFKTAHWPFSFHLNEFISALTIIWPLFPLKFDWKSFYHPVTKINRWRIICFVYSPEEVKTRVEGSSPWQHQ